MPAVMRVTGLCKRFGRHDAVADVSFDVVPGEVVGLLGPNGSGKSTTLHCITGLHLPSAGEIEIDGVAHDQPAAKDALGFFPDDLPVPESLTARETVSFHRRLRPGLDVALAEAWIELLGLVDAQDRFVGDYSHGMRRKLQLVLALAHRPRLLILDEPLRGLDPEAGALMSSTIQEFAAAGGSVLVATHDLHAAERSCDRVVVMSRGRVVASGTPASVTASADAPDLEQAFVHITGLAQRVVDARRAIADLINHPAEV